MPWISHYYILECLFWSWCFITAIESKIRPCLLPKIICPLMSTCIAYKNLRTYACAHVCIHMHTHTHWRGWNRNANFSSLQDSFHSWGLREGTNTEIITCTSQLEISLAHTSTMFKKVARLWTMMTLYTRDQLLINSGLEKWALWTYQHLVKIILCPSMWNSFY